MVTLGLTLVVMQAAAAQYPLAPSPVLDMKSLTRELRLSGYVSVRQTLRRDTLTFIVNRARLTAQVLPASFAALRVQVDFTATGQARADTIPAIVLTDAYIQLVPPAAGGAATRALRPALIIGQFRTPFALEFLTPFSLLPTANRSQPIDRHTTRRDIGVLAQLAVDHTGTFTGALVNGEGSNRLTNPDGKEMAIARVTVFPFARLAVAAKYLGQERDHRWGYDLRWMDHGSLVEGEFLARRGPFTSTTTVDARGGYLLASYRVRPWLQPVLKWEHLRDRRTTGATISTNSLTYTTVGINVLSSGETIRLLVDGIYKAEPGVFTGEELEVQLIAIF
ncbi:MAG: hypothetical protein AUJ01_04955 [Acidobacteria bacterium 13_1_40CM_3_65_5]|nr:MAG: hypothetical protein AUJ01_04955 [Acidobacteria bacterium 13_1_40CM_3_65_5]